MASLQKRLDTEVAAGEATVRRSRERADAADARAGVCVCVCVCARATPVCDFVAASPLLRLPDCVCALLCVDASCLQRR